MQCHNIIKLLTELYVYANIECETFSKYNIIFILPLLSIISMIIINIINIFDIPVFVAIITVIIISVFITIVSTSSCFYLCSLFSPTAFL